MLPYLVFGGVAFVLLRIYERSKLDWDAYDVKPQESKYILPEDKFYEPAPGQKLDSNGKVQVFGQNPMDARSDSSTEGVILLSKHNRQLSDFDEKDRVNEFNRLNVQASINF